MLANRRDQVVPVRVQQRLAAGDERHSGAERRQFSGELFGQRQRHVRLTVAPVVAGDALGIAAVGDVEDGERQRGHQRDQH